ncbi:hypothetical protein AOLI_G00242290 [Acnodon oligacanthus]
MISLADRLSFKNKPEKQSSAAGEDMPSSPVKTRIPLSSFGHLVTEVKRQLFGIEAPVNLTGWRKHFNSYTLQGRRNFVLATYGVLALAAAAYMMSRNKNEKRTTPAPSS